MPRPIAEVLRPIACVRSVGAAQIGRKSVAAWVRSYMEWSVGFIRISGGLGKKAQVANVNNRITNKFTRVWYENDGKRKEIHIVFGENHNFLEDEPSGNRSSVVR